MPMVRDLLDAGPRRPYVADLLNIAPALSPVTVEAAHASQSSTSPSLVSCRRSISPQSVRATVASPQRRHALQDAVAQLHGHARLYSDDPHQWQCLESRSEGRNEYWRPVWPAAQGEIEARYADFLSKAGPAEHLFEFGTTAYKIDFAQMRQTNQTTGKERLVRRAQAQDSEKAKLGRSSTSRSLKEKEDVDKTQLRRKSTSRYLNEEGVEQFLLRRRSTGSLHEASIKKASEAIEVPSEAIASPSKQKDKRIKELELQLQAAQEALLPQAAHGHKNHDKDERIEELELQLQGARDRCQELLGQIVEKEEYWQVCQALVHRKHGRIQELEQQMLTEIEHRARQIQESQDQVKEKDQCIEVILVLTKKLEGLQLALDDKSEQMELMENGAEERVKALEQRHQDMESQIHDAHTTRTEVDVLKTSLEKDRNRMEANSTVMRLELAMLQKRLQGTGDVEDDSDVGPEIMRSRADHGATKGQCSEFEMQVRTLQKKYQEVCRLYREAKERAISESQQLLAMQHDEERHSELVNARASVTEAERERDELDVQVVKVYAEKVMAEESCLDHNSKTNYLVGFASSLQRGSSSSLSLMKHAPRAIDWWPFHAVDRQQLNQKMQRILQVNSHCGRDCSCSPMKSATVLRVERNVNWQLIMHYTHEKLRMKAEHRRRGVSVNSLSPASLPTAQLQDEFPGLNLDVDAGEKLLFHGTYDGSFREIMQCGFDERLARESGLYGEGVYFSDKACKAFQYSAAGKNKTHRGCIILARVALGDPCYVSLGSTALPESDSLVANVGIEDGGMVSQAHREFVMQNGKRAYPDLAIFFEVSV